MAPEAGGPGIAHRVAVTGGSGHAGRWTVRELLDHGYDVLNVDRTPSDACPTLRADLTDLGQTIGVLQGRDAVVHLAAIPWAGEHPHEVVFRNNVMSTFNVLQAAFVLGIKRIVLASSECTLGFPFMFRPIYPEVLPIDETHPLRAQDAYGLTKVIGEELGRGFAERDATTSVVSLRFSWIQDPDDYRVHVPAAQADPGAAAFNLWAYVDVRDVASSVRCALERGRPGHRAYFIAAADTLMEEGTLDLVRRFLPVQPALQEGFGGHQSPLSIARAREEMGWEPRHTWRSTMEIRTG